MTIRNSPIRAPLTPALLPATRAATATGLLVLAFTACLPWNGEGCPYEPGQGLERLAYDWGNGKGLLLREDVESLPKDTLVGDNDVWDHRFGYRDGYFHGVLNAKFDKPNKASPDYPEIEAYVRSYHAGLEDGFDMATKHSGNERLAFAEGFSDGLLDGKDLCK